MIPQPKQNNNWNSNGWLRTAQAAAYLGISKPHLRQLYRTGQILGYKPTHKLIYFKTTDLDNWIQQK